MNTVPQDAVRIERADESDLPAIAELASVVWRACYPGMITTEQIDYMLAWMYSLEVMRDEIRSQGICYERMFASGAFVGFASYGPTESPRVFKLHKLYVHPNCQGRGFGGALLQHCEREAAKCGARQLVLNVNKNNAVANAVYRRSGFSVVDSVVVDIGSGFVMDDFIMAKELPPPQCAGDQSVR